MTEAGLAGIEAHYWIAPALTLACALSACGQKGPLRLPDPPKPAEPAK